MRFCSVLYRLEIKGSSYANATCGKESSKFAKDGHNPLTLAQVSASINQGARGSLNESCRCCSSGHFAANDAICDSSAGQSPGIPIRPGPRRRIDFGRSSWMRTFGPSEAADGFLQTTCSLPCSKHFSSEGQPPFAAHTSMPAWGVAFARRGQNEISD